MDDVPAAKPWVANKPEARLSIAVDRLLRRCLLLPHYAVALHDADGAKRTENQRARDANRGVKSGQLDWDVVQGPDGLARKLELKRFRGALTDNQKTTIRVLTECGAEPIVARDLQQVYLGLTQVGFRFSPNVRTVVAELEQHLAAWDREADSIKAGTIVRKKSRPPKPKPRFTLGKGVVGRARRAGIRV
jgi:hypothetical protein